MKKIVLLLVFFIVSFTFLETYAATKTYIDSKSKSWNTAANWSPAGVPVDGDIIIIQAGRTCYIDTDISGIQLASITIQSGAVLRSTTNSVINITGDIQCDGSYGSAGDLTDFYLEGTSQTISGTGTFYANSLQSDLPGGSHTLNINMSVTLSASNDALWAWNGVTLDVNLASGKTLNVPNGYISLDQVGADQGGSGVFTINGTVNTSYIEVFCDNTTNPGAVSYIVSNTGVLNVQEIRSSNSAGAGSTGSFNLQSGGNLYLTGTTPFGVYGSSNTDMTFSGNVHFSGAAQTISNVYLYSNLFLEGSGVKTIPIAVLVLAGGSLTLGGTATVSGDISYGNNSTLIYAGTAAQTTGPEVISVAIGKFLATSPANIIINNGYGVTLNRDIALGNTLTFQNGNLYTTSLYGITVTGIDKVVGETSNHYLIGNLRQNAGLNPAAGNYLGLVTDGAISGTSVMVTRVTGQAQVVGGNSGIKRYWDLTGSNITYNGNLTLNWLANEAAGMQMGNAIVFEYYPLAPHFIFMNDQNGLAATLSGDSYSLSSTLPASVVNSSSVTYTVGDKNSPLPVELSSFVAKADKKGVTLNWETASEVSNHGFDVERALVSADKKVGEFSKLGFVNGNGNSNSPKNYSFVDSKAVYGQYVYRLKQIDTDGKFEYSKTTEVTVNNLPSTFEMDQNYPNPFNPSTTIKFSVPKESFVNIAVYNMLGQKVATVVNGTMKEGSYEQTFNASNLSSGNYVYVMTAGDSKIVKKMVLVK
ncbi:MAG: T9SS type A sorting domain-containing protein [Bacteroidota bacterium]|nr:T9SS type A sorting domain-containing protein [Bacteroidota bacterium]